MPDDTGRAWVERVLGVKLHAKGQPGSFGKALARWRDARVEVTDHLAEFRAALLSDDTIKTDPRISFVTAAAAEIPRMLPPASRELEGLLKSEGTDQAAAGNALAAVAEYRQAMDAAAGLAALEAFATRNLRFPLAVRKLMGTALDDIEATLRAAA